MIHRYLDLLYSSPYPNDQILKIVIAFFSSLLVFLGIFTPVFLPVLAFTNSFISVNLTCQLVLITCLVIFLGNGWSYYSFDKILAKSSSIYQYFIYYSNSITFNINIIRTIGVYLWGGVCISALSFHFKDPSWINGTAVLTLLRTPYLNDYYEYFNQLNTNFLLVLSRLSLYGMAIWELILWPIPGIKLIRRITFVWGILFFISSIVFINLSYLPYVELLFWVLIYRPDIVSFTFLDKGNISTRFSPIASKSFSKIIIIIKNFIRLSAIGSLIVSNVLNIYILNFENSSRTSFFRKIYNNRYYKRWNYLWGQAEVNVFNEYDLHMNRYSTVICRITNSNDIQLVPFQDLNGGRLEYLANDSFYFNNSLTFQRGSIYLNWENLRDREQLLKDWRPLVSRVIEFDYAVHKYSKNIKKYKVFLLENKPYYFKSNFLAGWNIDGDPIIRETQSLNTISMQKQIGFSRLSIPPGHFNSYNRSLQTLKKYCVK
ncbi:hypothetical protein EU98_1808 [Prochlorococcus marinus str. MIT 9314]|uniref:Uncharacterized protein n=1 Tax=Prochlorococcus marinus str. MIT 9314 TaxID=167548 RepID=A0A0A2AFA1_PROMR|nr:hypothetical protein EU98_1808 [Prochlorococcus marinus str. MIT 9314]